MLVLFILAYDIKKCNKGLVNYLIITKIVDNVRKKSYNVTKQSKRNNNEIKGKAKKKECTK